MFCAGFYIISAEFIALNTIFFKKIPWSIVLSIALACVLIAAVAHNWCRYRILGTPGAAWAVAAYVASATLACISVGVIGGALFSMRVVPLSLPNTPGPLLAVAHAFFFPLLGAAIEEVGFRGILQGNLEASLGARAGFLIAATLFVAVHAIGPAFLPQAGLYMAVAVATGAVAARTQSVAPAMGIHLTSNAIFAAAPLAFGPINLGEVPQQFLLPLGICAAFAALIAWWSLSKLGVSNAPAPSP